MKEHSNDLRELVITHFLKGDIEREIPQKILISRNTVHSIIAKYKSTKRFSTMRRRRKRKTTANIDRIIQGKIKMDRLKFALLVKFELKNELGLTISESTIRRRLYEVGFDGRVALKKPCMSKDNRVKRLHDTKTYLKKALGYWNKVLWSDETKFSLFG